MSLSQPTIPEAADTILFRPNKKRKIYRQRASPSLDDQEPSAPSPPPATVPAQTDTQSLDDLISSASASILPPQNGSSETEDIEGVSVPMSEILRLRKLKKRGGGVEFRAAGHVARDDEGMLILRDGAVEAESAGSGVPRKFAPQTGMVGDVNRHMMAYIDSELAKRRVPEGQLQVHADTQISNEMPAPKVSQGGKDIADTQRQPATIGKLQEIDLGEEARARNIERTNNARRRLDGEEVIEETADGGGAGKKKKKVRLNRDGTVWKPRRRRGSDDVKRDQLVEAVLRENRLEHYEPPPPSPPSNNDDSGAADDRIADAFRRDFMDAVSARQRKKAVPAPVVRGPGGKKEEDVMKGPKLGGSRSARAAMREAMLKK